MATALARLGTALRPAPRLARRTLHWTELFMAALFLAAASSAVVGARWGYAAFLLLQGVTFAVFGLSLGVDHHKRTCCGPVAV